MKFAQAGSAEAAIVAALLLGVAGSASAQYAGSSTTGPSSSQSPYLQGIDGTSITSILTAGDDVGGYRMAGIPDGLGAFDNGDGTFTVLMNHEIPAGAGGPHASGITGAFVSEWVVDKSTLEVLSGNDLDERVYGWDSGTQSTGSLLGGAALNFQRFCSADLAAIGAYSYTDLETGTIYGTDARIFLDGEEVGTIANSRVVGHVVGTGDAYVLGKFNPDTNGSGTNAGAWGAWENVLTSPHSQLKTVVIGLNDGGTLIQQNTLAVYVGTKTDTGNEVEKAGLTNGTLKWVQVQGQTTEIGNSATRSTNITDGTRFSLSDGAATTFSRPEDGAWDTRIGKEGVFYFVTTDRLDNTELTTGVQIGGTRLWSLTFDDITNPDAGGVIDLLLDSTTLPSVGRPNMFDNIGFNGDGTITLVEDTGGSDHNAKTWNYDTYSGALSIVARSDTVRFGDVVGGVFTGPGSSKGIPNGSTGYHTFDEEASGVIDVTDILDPDRTSGLLHLLLDMQDHATAANLIAAGFMDAGASAAATFEGGQLMLLTVPEPGVSAMLLSGLGLVGWAARRRARLAA